MTIEHEIIIAADVGRVWELTVDVERWPDIAPTMTSVERLDSGPMKLGSSARIVQPRQRPAVWTVTKLEPQRLFEWSTTTRGVTMTATHRLTVMPNGVQNWLAINMSGFGSSLVEALVGRSIRKTIALENEGFKTAAEHR